MPVLNDIPTVENTVEYGNTTAVAGNDHLTAPLGRLLWLSGLLRNDEEYSALQAVNDLSRIVQTTVHSMSEMMGGAIEQLIATAMQDPTAAAMEVRTCCSSSPRIDLVRLEIGNGSLIVDMDCNDCHSVEGTHASIVHVLYTLLRQAPRLCTPYGRVTLTLRDRRDATLLVLAHPATEIPTELFDFLFPDGTFDIPRELLQEPTTLTLTVRRGIIEYATGGGTETVSRPTVITFLIDIAVADPQACLMMPLSASLRCTLASVS